MLIFGNSSQITSTSRFMQSSDIGTLLPVRVFISSMKAYEKEEEIMYKGVDVET